MAHKNLALSRTKLLLVMRSGLSFHALGLKMGYTKNPRQDAIRFLKSGDSRLLRRFAKALEIPLADLLDKNKKSRSK